MAIIQLVTIIQAPPARVFDLVRSVDAHQRSTSETGERAVEGVTSGLLGMNDKVTWEARHLDVRQRLTVRVTAFDRPNYLQDVMVAGAFKTMCHDHRFVEIAAGTQMLDRFEFRSPCGLAGWLVDRLFLSGYMRRFLVRRNLELKQLAESAEWKKYVGKPGEQPNP